MSIRIRKLKRSDRKTLTRLIQIASEKFGAGDLTKLVRDTGSGSSAEGEKDSTQILKIGMEVFNILLDVVEKDVTEWFADLIGVTLDEYEEMPFDTDLVIAEQLLGSEEMRAFFSRLSRLRSEISKLSARLQSARAASGSISG